MKAQDVMAVIGIILTGILCLGLYVIFAALAISTTSIGMALLCGFLALFEAATVVYIAGQVTKEIKEWF